MNLPRPEWIPPRHEYGDIKVDISAVGPLMCQVAGEVADGVHVHPMHSMRYIEKGSRTASSPTLPGIRCGANAAMLDRWDEIARAIAR